MAVVQAIIVKNFLYRGATEEFASVYHLDGTEPADGSAWDTLLNTIMGCEKLVSTPAITFTDGYGYNAGSWETKPQVADRHRVWTTSNVGSFSMTGREPLSGDTAYWVRWATGDTNSKGKPIYLRKYFHPGIFDTGSSQDLVPTGLQSALVTYANKFTDGTTLPGPLTICRPNGHHGGTALAGLYNTTRTLKRRGKRPNP